MVLSNTTMGCGFTPPPYLGGGEDPFDWRKGSCRLLPQTVGLENCERIRGCRSPAERGTHSMEHSNERRVSERMRPLQKRTVLHISSGTPLVHLDSSYG